jgi:hypothetical protein
MSAAYRAAGYKGTGQGMWAAASRLLSYDEVRMRVAELSAPAAKKASLSLESLLTEVERVLRDAEADKLHHVRLQALGLILRIHELVRDQGVAERQFAGAMDTSEIMALIRDLVGDVVGAVVEAAIVSDVYSKDIDKALEIIDGIRADLIDRVSAKAKLVS